MENSNTQTTDETTENQVVVHHHPKIRRNRFTKFITESNKRAYIFIGVFGLIGVGLLVRSFAATPQARLIRAGRNFAKYKPSVVTGNVSVTYKNSPNIKSIAADYAVQLNQRAGSSKVSGRVVVNGKATFPYDARYIDKTTYLRLGNTPALRTVIPKSSPVYPYASTRFEALDAINNQWIAQPPSTPSRAATTSTSPYSCVTNTPLYIDSQDSQQLSRIFSLNSPVSVKNSRKTVVGVEPVTRYTIVPSSKKNTDAFIDKLSNVKAFQRLTSCAQQVTNAHLPSKAKQAFQTNSMTVQLYLDKRDVIQKVEVSVDNKKATVNMSATLSYIVPTNIAKPAGAKPATDFYNAMFYGVSASDKVKEQDLYKINAAVEQYIVKNKILPASLGELNMKNLQGVLKNYTYTYTSRTTGGGPTLGYAVCASFIGQGSGKPRGTSTTNNQPDLYTVHKSGYNCWKNSYYKSGSHIQTPY